MRNVTIKESWPQTFVAGKIHCVVEAVDATMMPTAVVAKGEGIGTNCEIARANAYREIAGSLLSLIT